MGRAPAGVAGKGLVAPRGQYAVKRGMLYNNGRGGGVWVAGWARRDAPSRGGTDSPESTAAVMGDPLRNMGLQVRKRKKINNFRLKNLFANKSELMKQISRFDRSAYVHATLRCSTKTTSFLYFFRVPAMFWADGSGRGFVRHYFRAVPRHKGPNSQWGLPLPIRPGVEGVRRIGSAAHGAEPVRDEFRGGRVGRGGV